MNKKTITAAVAAALLASPVAFAEENTPQWLFVHDASSVEITDGGGMMAPVEREIFAFTDRPYRRHGYLNAHEFVGLWDGGEGSFQADPPNAVLTWVEDGEVQELEVELTSARVGDHGRMIHYEFVTEDGEADIGSVTDAALYIDACNARCMQINQNMELMQQAM
mgnify:CR=1 FL=1